MSLRLLYLIFDLIVNELSSGRTTPSRAFVGGRPSTLSAFSGRGRQDPPADRDRPGTYLQLVEFPSHAAAASNSDHPATAVFAAELRAVCTDDLVFRNLDVTEHAHLDMP